MSKIKKITTLTSEKVNIALEMHSSEFLRLNGNLSNIHIFSENTLSYPTKLVQRGKKESTKYFLLPRELRKDILPDNDVRCNKIETENKNLFIFELDKSKINLKNKIDGRDTNDINSKK